MLESKRAIIVGASSGIGAAMAKRLCQQGYHVAVLARREKELQELAQSISATGEVGGRAFAFGFDVKNFREVPALFDRIVQTLGGLDLFVYAAGTMPNITVEEYTFEKDAQMVEVNLLGAIAWMNEAAMFFSRIKSGTIVGISSIAGDRGRKGNPVYCSTKAAMNTFMESLRNRLDKDGVRVLTIKPGFVDTDMTRGKDGLFWLITADEAARQIIDAVQKRRNCVYVPKRWFVVGTVIKSIPSFIFRKMDI